VRSGGRSLWWSFAAVAFLAALLIALNLGPIMLLDGGAGIVALIQPPADAANLEFAAGFTRFRFLRVRRGWTRAEVLAQLGEPWFRQLDGKAGVERWCYSRGRNLPAAGRCRAVVFESEFVIRLE
jgi:hypothetical protein